MPTRCPAVGTTRCVFSEFLTHGTAIESELAWAPPRCVGCCPLRPGAPCGAACIRSLHFTPLNEILAPLPPTQDPDAGGSQAGDLTRPHCGPLVAPLGLTQVAPLSGSPERCWSSLSRPGLGFSLTLARRVLVDVALFPWRLAGSMLRGSRAPGPSFSPSSAGSLSDLRRWLVVSCFICGSESVPVIVSVACPIWTTGGWRAGCAVGGARWPSPVLQ